MTWSMEEQLAVGRKGEQLFLKKWPEPCRSHDKFKGPDYIDSKGRIIELKTDTYSMDRTQNFFIERWSDIDRQAPGGPWQAASKGVTCFVYLYINSARWFVFEDVPALIARLDALIATKPMHRIPNKGWTTGGYKVKRSELADLFREEVL